MSLATAVPPVPHIQVSPPPATGQNLQSGVVVSAHSSYAAAAGGNTVPR